jgi:hypothetical protein
MSTIQRRSPLVGISMMVAPVALATGAYLMFHSERAVPKRPIDSAGEKGVPVATVEPAVVGPSQPIVAQEAPHAVPAPAVEREEASRSPPLTDEARAALDVRRAEQMEAQFYADADPIAESRRMRRDLVDAFEGLAKRGVSVENVDCRYRLCRMSLLFDNEQADIAILKDVFVRDLYTEWSKRGVVIPPREYLKDGKVRTTVYVPREGTIEIID